MELDKLKIRHNLLNEENAELQSRLDVQCKQVKQLQAENKKVVEKYKELKMIYRVSSLIVGLGGIKKREMVRYCFKISQYY